MEKKHKTLIAYLDRVVINTLSGELYPTNYFDMKMNFGFLKALKDYSPDRLVLFVNRTIIKTGRKISNPEFWSKLNFIKTGIRNYIRISTGNKMNLPIISLYSIAYDWKLGLDQETSEIFINSIPDFKLDDTLFIIPNDGYGEDFCKEHNIEFITIEKFITYAAEQDQTSVFEERPSIGTGNNDSRATPSSGTRRSIRVNS